jgi:hypothetical protein
MDSETTTIEVTEPAPEASASRGQGLSEPILLDPHRIQEDARLVARAVKHRWPLKRSKCRGLVERLFAITEKTAVTVLNKKGETESVDGPADVNAVAAARVLVQMMGQNQEDENPKSRGTTVNVGVNIQQQYEERVAGRDYDELCAEIAAEAASVTKRLESR